MGLAVYAYRSLRFVEAASLASLKERSDEHPLLDAPGHTLLLVTAEEFRPRMRGMVEGFYAFGAGSSSFSAGSYSSHNNWRRQLAALVGVVPVDVWDRKVEAPAFGELIDFSDCDGAIGAEVSQKLARDFAAWAERAGAFAFGLGRAEGREFLARYRLWRRAFEVAAKGGAVRFH